MTNIKYSKSEYGGAIYIKNSDVDFNYCSFSHNEGDYGGAIYSSEN